MPRLGLNIDHIATLREARYRGWTKGLLPEPSLLQAAHEAEAAGVHSLTVHLREDRRHIQDADVRDLKKSTALPLNLEMSATSGMAALAVRFKPAEVCLVPENRQEITTEGGLDVAAGKGAIKAVVSKLQRAGIRVSAFIDPDPNQVEAARHVGADMVELHTGAYANATTARARGKELARQAHAAVLAHGLGLQVNAGHGLHYTNVREFIEDVPHLDTLNIGHAIVARAVFVGLAQAVQEMLTLLRQRDYVQTSD